VRALEPAVEALVEMAAVVTAWARGRLPEERVRDAVRSARTVAGATAVEESLLQSYLFLGYPTALNALRVLRSIEEEESGTGEGKPGREGTGEAPDATWPEWARRGAELCETVYGGAYGRLRANVRRLHPAMERWMVTEGYGKVLGRDGLGLGARELCIVATLAVSGWSVQLHSHLRGAIHAGVHPGTVGRALELALQVGRPTREEADEARRRWARVLDRRDGPQG